MLDDMGMIVPLHGPPVVVVVVAGRGSKGQSMAKLKKRGMSIVVAVVIQWCCCDPGRVGGRHCIGAAQNTIVSREQSAILWRRGCI